MVTVKQLIEKLKKYDGNAIVTIDASNYDGSADADLMVGGDTVASNVDYYNSDEIELV